MIGSLTMLPFPLLLYNCSEHFCSTPCSHCGRDGSAISYSAGRTEMLGILILVLIRCLQQYCLQLLAACPPLVPRVAAHDVSAIVPAGVQWVRMTSELHVVVQPATTEQRAPDVFPRFKRHGLGDPEPVSRPPVHRAQREVESTDKKVTSGAAQHAFCMPA